MQKRTTPQPPGEAERRAAMRERGYSDARAGRPKVSDDPEYLTSYRRGRESMKEKS